MSYHNIHKINKLPRSCLRQVVRQTLREDIGKKDITTELAIAKNKMVKAVLLAKEDCVICGLGVTSCVFAEIDRNVKIEPLVSEGQFIKKGKIIARLQGRAQSILTAERVALNFLSLLSGIATQTKKYVDKVRPYRVKIMDTRKTIPGLRELQKYAVRVGGGFNHRMRLDEMVLVKDNHFKVVSRQSSVVSLKNIVWRIREKVPKKTKIEIEVKNLKEFKDALKAQPDIIMLDNMNIRDIKKAVKIRRYTLYAIRYTLMEASGGITLENVKKIASTGVDMISVGGLTHSSKSVDISLEVL